MKILLFVALVSAPLFFTACDENLVEPALNNEPSIDKPSPADPPPSRDEFSVEKPVS